MKFSQPMTCLLLAFCYGNALSQSANLSLSEAVALHETAASVELIDRQAFMVETPVRNVQLSPDGKYVAWLARENHHTALHLLQLESGQKSRLFSSASLQSIYWSGDSSRLLLDLGAAVGVVDLANPARPAYVTVLDATRSEEFLAPAQAVLDHVLIAGRHDDGSYALEQVSLNGDSRELLRQDQQIVSAVAADDGESVVTVSATATGHQFSLLDGQGQTPLFSCALLDTCRLLAYQQQTNTIWLTSNAGSNLINLLAYSLDDRAFASRHSHANGVVDVARVILANNQPLVVQYHDGLLRNYGLDATTDTLLQAVQTQLPATTFTPQISIDGNTWLVTESSSDLQHPRYYLFAAATGMLTEILQEEHSGAVAISTDKLSERIPLQYRAQDGFLLHGYVSLPKGQQYNTTPMITLVHGGPFGRIESVYNDFTQFLVNRGYIVFEPNFRASTGYGREYTAQAAREFGNGRVQQDIIDGVNYLTSQGIGDPQQLAIAGHSFGGSAVLSGLAFTPALFKAGFASAPPADMAAVLQFQMTSEKRAGMDPALLALSELQFGAPEDAVAMSAMTAKSPQQHLAAITAPLLLIAGADDTQVPISHVKDYALELLNQQKVFSLFVDKNEGHGIGYTTERSKLAYFWMAEEFFATYLGGNKQTLEDPALAHYIQRNLLINTNPEFSIPVD